MNKEEVLKKLEEKVISYVKDSLGEEQYNEFKDATYDEDEISPADAIAEDFEAGFWYAVELFEIDVEREWKLSTILRHGLRRPRRVIRN